MRRRIRGAASVPMHRHSLPQIAVDGALIALAYYLSFQLRFEHGPTGVYQTLMDRTIVWVAVGGVVVLALGRVYERRWRYSSQRDYVALLRGVVMIALLTALAVAIARPVTVLGGHGQLVGVNLPNGITVLFLLLCAALLLGIRVLARTLHERRPLAALRGAGKATRSVLIVGAGDGGRLVLREILRNRELGLLPVGFLDDDRAKHGIRIDGVKVHGDTDAQLPKVLDRTEPDEVIIAIPSAPGSTRARVVRECRARGIPVRTLPTVFELLRDHGPSVSGALHGSGAIARKVREVRVEDVLGRDPVHVELASAGAYLAGEVVLVTGAGGSIGSELCRQIAQVHPRKIVLVDHAEDNLFEIARELEGELHVPSASLQPLLADCKEPIRMQEVFASHRPTIVFHAAAYKHVGLMEANPAEAVQNNAIATSLVASLAGIHGAVRFVLVSTDKAVSPMTVMGASKALAELSLEIASTRHPLTRYATVRFGNVLGSSGSVVPIFRRQIERGGPVTVTDPRMERYFMTIPEAVQLIIRAGGFSEDEISGDAQGGVPRGVPQMGTLTNGAFDGNGILDGIPEDAMEAAASAAELFVLDMGEPVKILDLARAMIELSGLDPDRDIAIEIIGARPGEKLSEELFAPHERRLATGSDRIVRIARDRPSAAVIESVFSEVQALIHEGDGTAVADRLVELACSPWAKPSSVKPAPAKAAPLKPASAKPAPAKPAPAKPAPAKPAPLEPAPVTPALATPALATPVSVNGRDGHAREGVEECESQERCDHPATVRLPPP